MVLRARYKEGDPPVTGPGSRDRDTHGPMPCLAARATSLCPFLTPVRQRSQGIEGRAVVIPAWGFPGRVNMAFKRHLLPAAEVRLTALYTL